jgi:hypothetical protein
MDDSNVSCETLSKPRGARDHRNMLTPSEPVVHTGESFLLEALGKVERGRMDE